VAQVESIQDFIQETHRNVLDLAGTRAATHTPSVMGSMPTRPTSIEQG